MRAAIVKAFGLVPSGLKNWVYRHPWLSVPLSRVLGRLVPDDRALIVTVRGGPNKGAKLAIDRNVPRVFWLNENYEKEVFEVMRRHIKPGMTVADIGAYIGFDTLAMSKWVGASGRVLAFEPDPSTADRLETNCRLNDVRNATVYRKAVSDRTGKARFSARADVESHLVSADHSSANGEGSGDGGGTVTIESVRLDDVLFAEPAAPVGLIKLDAEDFETEVLRGAPRVLAEMSPVWLIEIHSARSLTGSVRELLRHGYSVTPLDQPEYYAAAIAAVRAGGEAPAEGFARGHVLAEKP
jgi:FkbM family methyltransferase